LPEVLGAALADGHGSYADPAWPATQDMLLSIHVLGQSHLDAEARICEPGAPLRHRDSALEVVRSDDGIPAKSLGGSAVTDLGGVPDWLSEVAELVPMLCSQAPQAAMSPASPGS